MGARWARRKDGDKLRKYRGQAMQLDVEHVFDVIVGHHSSCL